MMKRIATRLAGLTLAIVATQANAVDLKQRLDVSTDIREPVFGQIYYDYHLGQHFSALNTLLLSKQAGVFSNDDASTEILLGDLYTEFGLPREGDVAISRVQGQDIPSSTRNMPWLRYGKLLYSLGNDAPTENYLRKPPANLTSYQDGERRLMLGNILIHKKSYAEAIRLLSTLQTEGVQGSYGLYNLGIAYLQDGQFSLGLDRLNQMIKDAGTDDESLNLKDKAALAIAYHYMKQGNYPSARESLLRVRLDSPYSSSALLTLAYSYYLSKEDIKKGLAPCLELQRRNPADPAVQESFLLSARIYEDLHFRAQALSGYRQASTVLREQLTDLEKVAILIDQDTWPDILSPQLVNTDSNDPLNLKPLPVSNDPTRAGLLGKLFASASFNEGFRQYQQLTRLNDLLTTRVRDSQALLDVAQQIEQRQPALNDKAAKLQELKTQYIALVKKWQDLQIRFKQMNNSSEAYTDAATQAETARLQQINRLARKLQKLNADGDPDVKAAQLRLNRLKNLTVFAIARHAASRDEIFDKLQQSTNQLREAKLRLQAIELLLADNRDIAGKGYSQKLPPMTTHLQTLQQTVVEQKQEYRNYLQTQAKTMLEGRRQQITGTLAEAYLGTERIQNSINNPAQTGSAKP